MPLFSLKVLASKVRKSVSRASYTTNVETSVIGSIYLTEEGVFKIKVNDKLYNVTQKSLVTKGKKILFTFSNLEKTPIIIVILEDNNITDFAHPYMALAPGYKVKGNIIENINKEQLFDVHKILLEIDYDARDNFMKNKKQLIQIYNERNKTIDSC